VIEKRLMTVSDSVVTEGLHSKTYSESLAEYTICLTVHYFVDFSFFFLQVLVLETLHRPRTYYRLALHVFSSDVPELFVFLDVATSEV
jgi:hypothetical protein